MKLTLIDNVVIIDVVVVHIDVCLYCSLFDCLSVYLCITTNLFFAILLDFGLSVVRRASICSVNS